MLDHHVRLVQQESQFNCQEILSKYHHGMFINYNSAKCCNSNLTPALRCAVRWLDMILHHGNNRLTVSPLVDYKQPTLAHCAARAEKILSQQESSDSSEIDEPDLPTIRCSQAAGPSNATRARYII
uniref:Uncharacterized protein n=1 Tax=Tetranychus urticae TaxID=32264 RepID=T1JZG4_TETUR